MIRVVYLTLSLAITGFSYNTTGSKPIKVAIVDSGFDFDSEWKDAEKKGLKKPKLCKDGHKDFTKKGIKDNHGHGTHIAGLIAKYAENSSYCLVIVKQYSSKNTGEENLKTSIEAFEYLNTIDIDLINVSGGGPGFSYKEYAAIKNLLDKGVIIVAAAGNESEKIENHVLKVSKSILYIQRNSGKIITKKPTNMFYPAAYDPRIISVQSVDKFGHLMKSSNYGPAMLAEELGLNVLSYFLIISMVILVEPVNLPL